MAIIPLGNHAAHAHQAMFTVQCQTGWFPMSCKCASSASSATLASSVFLNNIGVMLAMLHDYAKLTALCIQSVMAFQDPQNKLGL